MRLIMQLPRPPGNRPGFVRVSKLSRLKLQYKGTSYHLMAPSCVRFHPVTEKENTPMKHPFKAAMAALALCATTQVFAAKATPELQTETTLAQELNLSNAQMEQIKGLREQAAKDLGAVKLDAIGQDVIVNMIKSGKWDEAAAKKQLQTISDVQAEARYYRAHYLFEVSQVLTPEQKAKLHEMLNGGEAMY